MYTSVERVAARIGESSGDLRLGRTGRLSPAATGPRTGGNTFYGQHPAPRG